MRLCAQRHCNNSPIHDYTRSRRSWRRCAMKLSSEAIKFESRSGYRKRRCSSSSLSKMGVGISQSVERRDRRPGLDVPFSTSSRPVLGPTLRPIRLVLGALPVWTKWRREKSWPYRDWHSDRSVVQRVASRYTDYAIPAHLSKNWLCKTTTTNAPTYISGRSKWKNHSCSRKYRQDQ
jgi:hypothetical protein